MRPQLQVGLLSAATALLWGGCVPAPTPGAPGAQPPFAPSFDLEGLVVEGWGLRVALDAALGPPEPAACVVPPGQPTPCVAAWRRAGAAIDERWQPEGAGWRHSFVVDHGRGLVELPILVEGAIVEVDGLGYGATLATDSGVLRYDGLLAWDRDEVLLPLLAPTQNLMFGGQHSSYFSWAVRGLGDVNDDGYGDVAFGAHGWDNGLVDAGRALVHHGTPTGLTSAAAWSIGGEQTSHNLGIVMAGAGDVNGNGFDDLLLG